MKPIRPRNIAGKTKGIKPIAPRQPSGAATSAEGTTQVQNSAASIVPKATPEAVSAFFSGVDSARADVGQVLGTSELDQLWDKKDWPGLVDAIASHLAPLTGKRLATLDGKALNAWMGELHLLQHRTVGLCNKLSHAQQPQASKKALQVLQKIADLQTVAFERAVEVSDGRQPETAVSAWVVHKDTMKKQGFHTPEARLKYFIGKAEKFIERGGNLNDIRPVTSQDLKRYKSGTPIEWVVDAYDVARMADASKDKVSPGHTLMAGGEDALSAGTLKLFKNDDGEIQQAIIGTFSGHFRAGAHTLHHMARHLVAAGVPPERIVIQGGEAGTARGLEVIGRAVGKAGADVQRNMAELDADARRYNVFMPESNAVKPGPPTREEMKLNNAVFAMRQAVSASMADGVILEATGEASTIATAADKVLTLAENSGNQLVYGQAFDVLAQLVDFDVANIGEVARNVLKGTLNKWQQHAFGGGAVLPGDVLSPRPASDRATRIVATINPAATDAQLTDMLKAGMDVARFNPAHASPPEIVKLANRLRRLAGTLGTQVSIQIDLAGPKIRLGTFENPKNDKFNDIWLTEGDTVQLTNADVQGNPKLFPITLDSLGSDVKVGDRVMMNDGKVELRVKSVGKDKTGNAILDAEVVCGGKVWDKKGVNLPDSKISVPVITDEDLAVLDVVLPAVDVVAPSFVQGGADIVKLRQEMQKRGRPVPIIAKIERPEALDNLAEIAQLADGMMVARGDLGVEIGYDSVPAAEARIIEAGNALGKPTMVATEVLLSMADGSARPSHGDTNGLYAAVTAGVAAVMLGKEASFPDDPGEVVRAASRIIDSAETAVAEAPFEQLRGQMQEVIAPSSQGANGEKQATTTSKARRQFKPVLRTKASRTNAGKKTTSGVSAKLQNRVASSATGRQIQRQLGLEKLDQLQATGDVAGAVKHLEKVLSPLSDGRMSKLDGQALSGWIGELHVLQHRTIGLCNASSMSVSTKTKQSALALLQKVGDLQSETFERAVSLADAKSPEDKVEAWAVHRDTMKQPGYHRPLDRLRYFAKKSEEYLAKGGHMNDIKSVTLENLAGYKSGNLVEWVVDAYDTARMSDAETEVTPGHTLLSGGEDALSAGSMRVYKNDAGDIENVLLGTFSGHFRAGAQTVHQMARHLVAAGIPAEKITIQGGEAGTARALEVLNRSLGVSGADVQRQVDQLDAEAARYNPYAVRDPELAKPFSVEVEQVGERTAPDADQIEAAASQLRTLTAQALGGGKISLSEGKIIAAALNKVLTLSGKAGNPVAFYQALALAHHIGNLPDTHIRPETKASLRKMIAHFGSVDFGAKGPDPASILSPRPIGDRRARIVATLSGGMAVREIQDLAMAGMNVARLNAAHLDIPTLKATIRKVRAASTTIGRPISVQVDLAGPRIRLGKFENPENLQHNDIELIKGSKLTVTNADVLGNAKLIPIADPNLRRNAAVGHRIFLAGGAVELKVTGKKLSKEGNVELECVAMNSGTIWDGKTVNLPDTNLTAPNIGAGDQAVLDAVLDDVDLVAVSFVRDHSDILRAREEMKRRGREVPIVAKIGTREAMQNLSKIAALSDALMVTSSDLMMELGPQQASVAAHKIHELGNKLGKPTMVANEVLTSMRGGDSRPARGEVAGLYDAMHTSGADAVVLGRETSGGKNGPDIIRAADQIVIAAEEESMARLEEISGKNASIRANAVGGILKSNNHILSPLAGAVFDPRLAWRSPAKQ